VAVVPGLFSANANGQGVAAANVQAVATDGTSVITNAAAWNGTTMAALPIDVTAARIYITLYGTGLRYATGIAGASAKVGDQSVPVLYIGEAPGYPGLDQVNLGPLPLALAAKGSADVQLTVDGLGANVVTLTFK
jgi:uncharacterized protein (TIGR03437 family)